MYTTACVYRELYGKITDRKNIVLITIYFIWDIYLHNFFLRSVIFPYNSLYTQAVAYTTYFELGELVFQCEFLSKPSSTALLESGDFRWILDKECHFVHFGSFKRLAQLCIRVKIPACLFMLISLRWVSLAEDGAKTKREKRVPHSVLLTATGQTFQPENAHANVLYVQ